MAGLTTQQLFIIAAIAAAVVYASNRVSAVRRVIG